MRSIVQYNRKDAIVNNLGTFFLWILLGLMTIVPQRIPIIAEIPMSSTILFVTFFIVTINKFKYLKEEEKKYFLLLIFSLVFLFISRTINGYSIDEVFTSLMRGFALVSMFFFGFRGNFWIKWRAFSLVLYILVVVNFITILLYPNGMSSNELYSLNWFLGYKNGMVRTMMPALTFSVIDSMHNHGKIVIKDFILYGICIASVILGDSSTSLVMLIIFMPCVLIFTKKRPINKLNIITLYLVVGIISVSIVVFGVQTYFADFLGDYLDRDVTFTGRTYAWEYTLIRIMDSPIIGFGYHDGEEWRDVLGFFGENGNNAVGFSHPHNYILYMILQGGFIYLALYSLIIWYINKKFNTENQCVSFNILVIMYFCFFVEGITESVTGAVLFYPMLALFPLLQNEGKILYKR